MERDRVIGALKAHEQELRTSRGEDSADDVDIAVRGSVRNLRPTNRHRCDRLYRNS